MIAKIGTLRKYGGISDWWTKSSATVLAAWQAKGAASLADARVDLTGNGYDLSGGSPTWTMADGITDYVAFDTISGLTLPTTISVVWVGKIDYSVTGAPFCISNGDASWSGLIMHGYTPNQIFVGYNSSVSQRFASVATSGNAGVFIYTKNESTGAQAIFENGSSLSSNTSGTTPTVLSLKIGTSDEFHGAAVYDGILDATDITAISDYFNNL